MSLMSIPDRACCETRRRLAEQYAISARLFAEAVVLLTRDPAAVPPGLYERLCAAVLEAQVRAELAGVRFEEHVDSHRCGQPDADAPNRSAAGAAANG
jgi:hypothetical protein